ncbi:MAG: AAA family ATPase, partial [Fibrobacterota bacterium]
YLSGTYAGNIPATEAKIVEYLETEADRSENMRLPQIPVVHTSAFIEISNSIQMAVQKKALISVTGKPGIGKTTAIKEYVKTHASAILIEVHRGYNSRDLFGDLCEALSLPVKGTLHAHLKRVVEKLDGSGRLIVVDQAEYLPVMALDMLRSVRDFAGVPIVLVGLPVLNEIVQGDKRNFAQFSRRMRMRRRIGDLTEKDEGMIIRAYLPEAAPDVVEAIRKFGGENAGVLVELIDWVLDLCRLNKGKLTLSPEAVATAAEYAGLA